MNKKGFTLIELLVVIAVIATITAIAVVGLNRARDQSLATRTLNDLRAIEKSLNALMLEQERSAYWRDIDFGAGADPAISNIPGLTQFLPKIPDIQLPGVTDFIYDNDGDTLAAASNDLNGVNIILNFGTSTTAQRDKFFNMMDEAGDYGSGAADGKLRTNGTDIIFFNLTPNEDNW